MRVLGGLFCAGASLCAGMAMAQDKAENACEAGGRNGMVATVACPAGLDEDAWKAAGVAACGEELPCGAWIWEDAALLPEDVPARHDELSEAQITTAVAIWVAENQQLILIGREAKAQ